MSTEILARLKAEVAALRAVDAQREAEKSHAIDEAEKMKALAERWDRAAKAEAAEVERLKHDIERHIAIASSEADQVERLKAMLREVRDAEQCLGCADDLVERIDAAIGEKPNE